MPIANPNSQRVYRPLTGSEILELITQGFDGEILKSQMEGGKPPSKVGEMIGGVFKNRVNLLKLKRPRLTSIGLGWPFCHWVCLVDMEWEPGFVDLMIDIDIQLNEREKIRDTLPRTRFSYEIDLEDLDAGKGDLRIEWGQKAESAPDKLRERAGLEIKTIEGGKQASLEKGGQKIQRGLINSVDLDYTSPKEDEWKFEGHTIEGMKLSEEETDSPLIEGIEGLAQGKTPEIIPNQGPKEGKRRKRPFGLEGERNKD